MQKLAGKITPPQDDRVSTSQNSIITDTELEAIALERKKTYLYRIAMLDNSQDLLSLLILVRDKKMENFINAALEGAFACTTALFLGATLFGISLSAPVIGVTFVGGALINAFVED